jgi:hypothetical protein
MPRGSSPGERRGGRQKGTPNKVTADVRALAGQYGEKALKTLAKIMESDNEPAAARVSAAKEILDRAYGKAPQPIAMNTANLADVFASLLDQMPA